MKNVIYLLSILFLISCTTNDKGKNDLSVENLRGSVKSLKETTYRAVDKFGQLSKGEKTGISDNQMFDDGSLSSKHTVKYDDKGNQNERNLYNSDGILRSKETVKYDDKGNLIEWNSYNSDGSLSYKETNKYDDKGNRIEENWYNSDGSLSHKYTNKYDDKGNQNERNKYNSDGSLSYEATFEYIYDEKNNWIKRILFWEDIPKKIVEREIEYY